MKKILEISSCLYECPLCKRFPDTGEVGCKAVEATIGGMTLPKNIRLLDLDNGKGFPPWCPLETKVEQKEEHKDK